MPPDGIANIVHSPEDLRAKVTVQVADENRPSSSSGLSCRIHRESRSRSAAAECVETAGVDQFARQLVPDDLLGHAADLD
jgi:hypothetical protein